MCEDGLKEEKEQREKRCFIHRRLLSHGHNSQQDVINTYNSSHAVSMRACYCDYCDQTSWSFIHNRPMATNLLFPIVGPRGRLEPNRMMHDCSTAREVPRGLLPLGHDCKGRQEFCQMMGLLRSHTIHHWQPRVNRSWTRLRLRSTMVHGIGAAHGAHRASRHD